MACTKRKYGNDSPNGASSKKSRPAHSVEARVDPTYGQRSAIPGLDDDTAFGDEDELDYSEDMNALAYLRAVRQEAIGIPNLLNAPRTPPSNHERALYENGIRDFRGKYEDGAYLATSENFSDSNGGDGLDVSQACYYDSILSRHRKLRAQLQQTPPAGAVERLGTAYPIHMPYLNSNHTKFWKYHMEKMAPRPAQIASMDKGSVLRLLGLLAKDRVLKRGMDVKPFASSWIWSLLAKLPERGELTSEEIGVVRELGKKAVLVGTGLKDGNEWDVAMQEVEAGLDDDWDEQDVPAVVNEEEIELDLDDDHDDQVDEKLQVETSHSNANIDNHTIPAENGHQPVYQQTSEEEIPNAPENLEALKARLLQRVETEQLGFAVNLEPEIFEPNKELTEDAVLPAPSKWNTKATVDMIITVAGEVYGQRDLLEFRGLWNSKV